MKHLGHFLGLDGAVTEPEFVRIIDGLPLGAELLEFAHHGSPRRVSVFIDGFAQVVQVFVVLNVRGCSPCSMVAVSVVGFFPLGWSGYVFHAYRKVVGAFHPLGLRKLSLRGP